MLIILKDVFRFVNNQMRGQAIFQVELCDTWSSVSETVLYYKIYIKSICTVIQVIILYLTFFSWEKKGKKGKIRDHNTELIFFYFYVRY